MYCLLVTYIGTNGSALYSTDRYWDYLYYTVVTGPGTGTYGSVLSSSVRYWDLW